MIRNQISGKVYVGQSRDIRRRWRAHQIGLREGAHSNDYLQKAWDKDGESAFEFLVLELCQSELLNEREGHFAALYRSLDRERGYNLETFEDGKKVVSQETRERMAARKRGKPMHPSTQVALQAANKGREMPKEVREKLRQKNLGKKASPETRRKLSETHKGYSPTEEHRARLSAAGRGRTLSPEHRAKISAANQGRTRTPAQILAASEARKGKKLSDEARMKRAQAMQAKREAKAEANQVAGEVSQVS